jgi:tetratricopeptide (TPR) repeat protein
MDATGLLLGVVALAPTALPWHGRELAIVLAAAALVAVAVALAYGRRRRRVPKTHATPDPAHTLKERLRRRLSQPPEVFAASAVPGPTLGANEAFESDLDAAASEVLPEAGWRCGAAKQLLRRRINAHTNGSAAPSTPNSAPKGAANGTEAAHWRQLGALALLQDTEAALAAYSRAAELAREDADLQMLVGILNLRTGRLEAAEAAFRRQLELAAGREGGEAARFRAGAMLGDALLAKGAREDALAAYEAALKELLALTERDPANMRWQRDSSVMHDRIGDALLADGQADLALASFTNSLKIAEALAQDTGASPGLQHDLSVACDRIGDALELKGDLDGALKSFRRGLQCAEAVARLEPDRLDWRWDISVSLDRIGDVLAAKGRADEALSAYRRSVEIAESLAGDSARLDWQRDLAVACHKIGTLEAQCGREAEAREALERGKAIVARLEEIARYRSQWRADLSKFDAALRDLGP